MFGTGRNTNPGGLRQAIERAAREMYEHGKAESTRRLQKLAQERRSSPMATANGISDMSTVAEQQQVGQQQVGQQQVGQQAPLYVVEPPLASESNMAKRLLDIEANTNDWKKQAGSDLVDVGMRVGNSGIPLVRAFLRLPGHDTSPLNAGHNTSHDISTRR